MTNLYTILVNIIFNKILVLEFPDFFITPNRKASFGLIYIEK